MHWNRHVRADHLHELDALLCIHRDHEEGHAGARDGGAAEVDEHEVDGAVRVAFRDFEEFGDQEGVAAYVDAGGEGGGERGRGDDKGGEGRGQTGIHIGNPPLNCPWVGIRVL